MRVARLAALLAAAAAVTYLLVFLFGPLNERCTFPSIGSGQPSPVSTPGCRSMGWLEMSLGEPGPFNGKALLFLITWTAAPFLAVIGTRLPATQRVIGLGLVLCAFVIEASSIISMGGGFVYALLCGPLLLIALITMSLALARERMG